MDAYCSCVNELYARFAWFIPLDSNDVSAEKGIRSLGAYLPTLFDERFGQAFDDRRRDSPSGGVAPSGSCYPRSMPGAYRGMCQVGGLETNLVQGTEDFQSWARGCTSNRSGSGNTLAVITADILFRSSPWLLDAQ